jgi:hypothetical protein
MNMASATNTVTITPLAMERRWRSPAVETTLTIKRGAARVHRDRNGMVSLQVTLSSAETFLDQMGRDSLTCCSLKWSFCCFDGDERLSTHHLDVGALQTHSHRWSNIRLSYYEAYAAGFRCRHMTATLVEDGDVHLQASLTALDAGGEPIFDVALDVILKQPTNTRKGNSKIPLWRALAIGWYGVEESIERGIIPPNGHPMWGDLHDPQRPPVRMWGDTMMVDDDLPKHYRDPTANYIILRDNPCLTDETLRRISGLWQLTGLELGNTLVTGHAFAGFRGWRPIRSLDLSNTLLDDTGCALLSRFKNLRDLSLRGTRIEGRTLSALGQLKKLENLNLADTIIDAEALQGIGKLESLLRIHLPKSLNAVSNSALRAQFPQLKHML